MAKRKQKAVKIFDDLRQALSDAQAYERGGEVDLRVTEFAPAPKPKRPREIREIRESLHASQAAFAQFLCVSRKAVESWEQGTRRPQNTALRLLDIAKDNPKVLIASRKTRKK
jgi:putative transcriptional regulator